MMRNPIDYRDRPRCEGGISNVYENFYRWAMLSNYIPNHCKSVKTEVAGGSDSVIRSSAFVSGDAVTVVLELNAAIGDGNGGIKHKLAAKVGDSSEFDSVNNTVRFGENAEKGNMFAIKATAGTPTQQMLQFLRYWIDLTNSDKFKLLSVD